MLEAFLSSISVWLLLKILALAGYTFIGVALLRRRAELVNFLVVSSVICVLYVFSVTGLLLPGYWLVLIGGWVSFACASGLALRRPGILGDFLTPGWLCFLAFTIYYSYLVHDTVPLYWDEFAHWGLSAKEMLHTDALLDQSALYPNLGYPPGFQLMAYFVTKGVPSYEQGFYTGHFIMGASALWTLSANVRWKDVYWTPLLAAVSLFLYATFNRAPANLQVDILLGAFFGAAVSSYLVGSLRGFALLALAPGLFALALIKPFGFLLALVAATLIGLHSAMEHLLGRPLRFPADRGSNGAGTVRSEAPVADETEIAGRRFYAPAWLTRGARLVPVLTLFAAPLAAEISWEARLARLGIEREHSVAGITYQKLSDAFSSQASPTHKRVRRNFFDKFTTAKVGGGSRSRVKLDTIGWVIVVTTIMALGALLSWRGIAIRSAAVTYLCLGLGLAAYLLCLLVFYLLVQPYWVAITMPAYARYTAAYLSGFLMVACAFLTLNPMWDEGRKSRLGKYLVFVLVVVALVVYAAPKGGLQKAYYAGRGWHFDIWTLQGLSEEIRGHVSQGDKVDFLHFGGDGYAQIIFRYFCYPIRVVSAPPSVTTTTVTNRSHSHLSAEDLGRRLNDADFLFVSKTTPEALREYSSVFGGAGRPEGGPSGLYEILKTGDDARPILLPLPVYGYD